MRHFLDTRKKKFVSIGFVFFAALLLLAGLRYAGRVRFQRQLAEKIIRFHVIANSDSAEDQALKLTVRDAVGGSMAGALAGASDAAASRKILTEHLADIEQAARQTVREAGYDYAVKAQLLQTQFPVKTYGFYTFPAGTYEALELVIGEGKGHNWWCVMYPNLCFSGSVYECVGEENETGQQCEDADAEESGNALRQVLSVEEYEKVLAAGNYRVQFRYLPFLNELCGDGR